MRKYLILFFLLIFSFSLFSQSIRRHAICSSGDSFSSTNIILESTLGQPSNIGTVTDGSNYIRNLYYNKL